MTTPNSGETQVSTNLQLPSYQPDKIVHFILGQHAALIDAINRMAVLSDCVGEAGPEGLRIAWTDPMPTGRNGEYIGLMSKRIVPLE